METKTQFSLKHKEFLKYLVTAVFAILSWPFATCGVWRMGWTTLSKSISESLIKMREENNVGLLTLFADLKHASKLHLITCNIDKGPSIMVKACYLPLQVCKQ